MLDINDAVKVTMDYMRDHCDGYVVDHEDEELIHQDMEQKLWITEFNGEPYLKQLTYMICDINPAEICSHIESGDLEDWCEAIQVGMQMCLIKMAGNEEEALKKLQKLDDTSCRDCEHFGDWHYCKNCYGYDYFEEV